MHKAACAGSGALIAVVEQVPDGDMVVRWGIGNDFLDVLKEETGSLFGSCCFLFRGFIVRFFCARA